MSHWVGAVAARPSVGLSPQSLLYAQSCGGSVDGEHQPFDPTAECNIWSPVTCTQVGEGKKEKQEEEEEDE